MRRVRLVSSFRLSLLLAGLLVFILLAPAAVAQDAAGSAPTAADVSELKSSLAATRAQLTDCQQQIALLRSQLQQVLTALSKNGRIAGVTERPVDDTVTSSAAPRQLLSGGPQAEQYPAASAPAADSGNPSAAAPDQGQDQDMLAAQVQQMEQTKVASASRYKVRLSGLVLMNAFSNSGNVDIMDLPNLAFRTQPGFSGGNVGATLRQTILGAEVNGPDWLGAHTSGDVQVDFFGGFPTAHYGETAGLIRLRTAHARLDWRHTSVIASQDSPFFSPLSPTSYATLGEPAMSWAGNLWVWTPQVEVEHRWTLSDKSSFFVQGGVLDPLTEEIPDFQFNRVPTEGENARRPAVAAHTGWSGVLAGRDATFGAGTYYERQAYGFGRNVDAWAATGDWNLPLVNWLEWSGEVYRGRALGGLGGGIWKSVVYNGTVSPNSALLGLNDIGGWTQLKFHVTPKLEFNAAAGAANPFAHDLQVFANPVGEYSSPLSRNQAAFVNSIYRPRSNLLLALEYRHLRTYNLRGIGNSADHVNLAVGVSF